MVLSLQIDALSPTPSLTLTIESYSPTPSPASSVTLTIDSQSSTPSARSEPDSADLHRNNCGDIMIDDLTSVPEHLYEALLDLAAQVKARGQHHISADGDHLIHHTDAAVSRFQEPSSSRFCGCRVRSAVPREGANQNMSHRHGAHRILPVPRRAKMNKGVSSENCRVAVKGLTEFGQWFSTLGDAPRRQSGLASAVKSCSSTCHRRFASIAFVVGLASALTAVLFQGYFPLVSSCAEQLS